MRNTHHRVVKGDRQCYQEAQLAGPIVTRLNDLRLPKGATPKLANDTVTK